MEILEKGTNRIEFLFFFQLMTQLSLDKHQIAENSEMLMVMALDMTRCQIGIQNPQIHTQ